MKFSKTLTDIIKLDLQAELVPALMGEPGIGKSSFVEDLAKQMNTQAFVLPCNQLADKADLTGARLVPTEDGTSYQQIFYPHFVVQSAIEYAENNPREWPILFLDEINRTTADVTSAVLTLVTLRQLGSIRLPKNLRLMVAGNDKGNVTTLDEASLSRFAIYKVEPDAHTLISLLGKDLNPYVKAVLKEHPNLVFAKSTPNSFLSDGPDDMDDDNTNEATFEDLFAAGDEMLQLTTPRTIEGISRWLNNTNIDELTTYLSTPTTVEGRDINLLQEIIEAHIGNTQFAVYLLAEISEAINSGTAEDPEQKVPKPNVYDDLKSATTISELEAKLADLTDNEKSGSLLYALYEKEDNSHLIAQLAVVTEEMTKEHKQILVTLASTGELDNGNKDALIATKEKIAKEFEHILSLF